MTKINCPKRSKAASNFRRFRKRKTEKERDKEKKNKKKRVRELNPYKEVCSF